MAFSGFPSGTRYTSVPNPLLGPLLEEIQDLAELKVVLRGIWLLQRKRGWPRLISQDEFLADSTLARAFAGPGKDPRPAILGGLRSAVDRGIFLVYEPKAQAQPGGAAPEGAQKVYYLLNDESGRRALSKLAGWDPAASGLDPSGTADVFDNTELPEADRPDIFALYEDNVGMLSPILAEELKEAEELYAWSWIREAFEIAVTENKRSWRYIAGILRRWAAEGKGHGKPGRHPETDNRQKFIADYQRRWGSSSGDRAAR